MLNLRKIENLKLTLIIRYIGEEKLRKKQGNLLLIANFI